MDISHEKRLCSKCGKSHTRNDSYCADCHAEYMREWRKTHPLTADQKKKDIARSYAGVYKRLGKIQEQPCEVCGEPAQMYHPNYDEPLNIQWLCRKHHLALHKQKALV